MGDVFGTVQIKYLTWDGTPWSATIQNITWQLHIKIGPFEESTVIDPDFTHTDAHGKSHRSDDLAYISDAGQHWRCKIHAHNDGTIEFEHIPQNGGPSHPEKFMNFRTWDGTCQQGTLHDFRVESELLSGVGQPVNITFSTTPCVG